ncbi:MAG TPA: hypothetical protein VLQ91_11810 [Draconibacterium sp.]|nr:hypothetical protein [Draconibacterium sp.]
MSNFWLFIDTNIRVIYLIYKYLTRILCFFLLREQRRKTTAAEKGKIIVYRIKSVIAKRFPELFRLFNELEDSRKRTGNSMSEIVTGALFMHLLKEGSRNAYTNDRCDAIFAKNYYRHFKLRLPHPDTIDEVMRTLEPELLEELKAQLMGSLFEQKVLRHFRFLGKYYFVAVDATGMHTFDHKHCDHCLTKTSKHGVTTWFHYVLEAKLVTSSGLAISLASEFIENQPGRDYEKQDCEQKAFARLAAKIKKYFPRLPICILADGLYPNKTMFNICRNNNWRFIITLKDGNLKTFHQEVELLRGTQKEQQVYRADKTSRTSLTYRYLNNIEYEGHSYSWVSCDEHKTRLTDKLEETQRFVYITDINQTPGIIVSCADGGRLRWKIENEGFNTQKNLGYVLEHKFSRVSYTAMQNYYHLLQIAHAINQFVEKSADMVELLNQHSKQTIKALWKELITYLKSIPFSQEQLLIFLSD